MTNAVRSVCLCAGVFGVFGCLAQSEPPAEQSGGQAQGASRRLGDLVLEVADPASAITFGHREIAEDSCEIYEGCALGAGRRSVMQIRVDVRNAGRAAIDLGHPWESALFHPSLCQHTNTLYGFISAELRDSERGLVASGSLASNCVADRDGGYTCMAQGLSVGGVAAQPEGQCDYLDVTGVPAGDYHLRLTVNPSGDIPESDRNNNSVEFAIHYPACDGELCGGICCPAGVACRDGMCLLPDLRVNAESAAESLWLSHQEFDANSCELEEQCVSGGGRRRLLNFEGRIENWGPGDLSPGPEHDNPLFEYSACHDHYHFRDFTDYRLLDAAGAVVAQGHKQSFCLVDMEPVDSPSEPSPPGTRPAPEPRGIVHLEGPGGEPQGCNYLSAGWADIYGVGTPCQWVDVTDVPAGEYVLQLSVNPLGRVAEADLDNNTVLIPVQIPEDVPCEPQPEVCGDAIDQDCDEQPDAWDQDCWTGGCHPEDPFCEAPTAVSGNDTCDAAFELVETGTFSGTLAATETAPAACGGSGGAGYFKFELMREQAVYLGAIGSSTDTVIALYRGDCSAEPIRCADDDCSTRSGHFVEILPAGSYVAAVRSKTGVDTGVYRFKFERAEAAGARIIPRPGVYPGNTEASGDDVQACSEFAPPGFGAGPDDVYVLASCNAPVTVSTCGSSTFYSVLEVRTAIESEFEPMQCSSGGSDACQADPLGVTMTAYTTSNGMMFITVDGERADDAGEYQLSVSY